MKSVRVTDLNAMKSQQLTWPEQHGKRTEEGLDLHESCTVAPEIEQIKFTGKNHVAKAASTSAQVEVGGCQAAITQSVPAMSLGGARYVFAQITQRILYCNFDHVLSFPRTTMLRKNFYITLFQTRGD